jgi:hypothetical protein
MIIVKDITIVSIIPMAACSLIEQIKTLTFEERHQILTLLNEKEPKLVVPLKNRLITDIIDDPNYYGVKSHQKPVCQHKELIASRYSCDECNNIRPSAIKYNIKTT